MRNNLEGELLEKSKLLDQLTSDKQDLQDSRIMENIALEFSRECRKEDVLGGLELFKDALKDDSVKEKFIGYMRDHGIPIVSEGAISNDAIIWSVMDFIRNDRVMPS